MLRPSANLNPDFLGTAAELASYVAMELYKLGFSQRFYPNERLVRYYAWEDLLDRPAPSNEGDRRRKLFDGKQAKRLLAARILSERGSGVDAIRHELKSAAAHKDGLDRLIDNIASVGSLEGRDDDQPMPDMDSQGLASYSPRPRKAKSLVEHMVSDEFSPSFMPLMHNRSLGMGSKLRRISESSSPGMLFRKTVLVELDRDDLSDEARALYKQLLAFHPTDPSEPPKRERWSKVRLAPWCEVLLRIDEKQRPEQEEVESIVSNFRKALENSYMQ
ncbi:MAG: hypothetical protein ACKORB_04500 [Opitutia bacterium]